MNDGLYSAVSAMRGSERAIEHTAHNLANLSTPGFKRTRTSAQEFVLLTDHATDRARTVAGSIDFEQGVVVPTGDPLQLALDGDGFFAFESPTGEVLTRDGSFTIGRDGELLSTDGLPAAWDRRNGRLDPVGLPPEVRADGTVLQAGREVGRLRLVDVTDRAALEQLSGGWYRAPRDAQEINATATVQQGARESANVTGVEELVEMVAHQRTYDVASRSLALISSSYERLHQSS